jgi:hypothetical protein
MTIKELIEKLPDVKMKYEILKSLKRYFKIPGKTMKSNAIDFVEWFYQNRKNETKH